MNMALENVTTSLRYSKRFKDHYQQVILTYNNYFFKSLTNAL